MIQHASRTLVYEAMSHISRILFCGTIPYTSPSVLCRANSRNSRILLCGTMAGFQDTAVSGPGAVHDT